MEKPPPHLAEDIYDYLNIETVCKKMNLYSMMRALLSLMLLLELNINFTVKNTVNPKCDFTLIYQKSGSKRDRKYSEVMSHFLWSHFHHTARAKVLTIIIFNLDS